MEGLIGVLSELGRRFQKAAKLLSRYQALLSEPVRRVYERERSLAELAEVIAGLPEGELKKRLSEWLEEERERLERAREEFRFEFGREFLSGLDGSGMRVQGQLPFLRVGLFSVQVDFSSGRATVFWGPGVERLRSGVRLESGELVRVLRSYQEGLERWGIREPREFLLRLWSGYQRVCVLRGVAEGERVFLVELLGELVLMMQSDGFRVNPVRERFVEYPRVRFSYDLYLLRRSGVRTVEGREVRLSVANFDATAEKARALWVPDNEEGEGTYYSYISFVRF